MTVTEATNWFIKSLQEIYPAGESTTMTDWVMEHITGERKNDRMSRKEKSLTPEQEHQLSHYLQRLLDHEPVQYVLNESWFCGLKFYVDNNVLVPRPETEELVEWIIADCKFPVDELRIFDIGSGSGCIPISLKRRIRKAEVSSCDKSPGALVVARRNAAALGTDVHFLELDFLDKTKREQLGGYDIIVSNPPYVTGANKLHLAPNVARYEPPSALFVPDDDPLVFYKAIADFGKKHLRPGGAIYVEINESYGKECRELFTEQGYEVELKKDMQGKVRMMKLVLSFKF